MKPVSSRTSRRKLALAFMLVGCITLLSMPSAFVVLAFSGATDTGIPGTLLIISAALGMGLIGLGAALYD